MKAAPKNLSAPLFCRKIVNFLLVSALCLLFHPVWCKIGFFFHSFMCKCIIFQHFSLKKTFFSIEYLWISIDILVDFIYIVYFIGSQSCFIALCIHIVVDQTPSHVWLCDSMNCSTPGFSVLHYLPKFAQTHVHWVDDVIQSSHPLFPTSPLALNLFQHQDLF